MKVRRNKLDIVFSLLVRTLAKWTCQRCQRYFPEDERRYLHCSHFHSRRKQSTRFDKNNATAHCFTCHQYLGENPIEFQRWILAHLGPKEYELLNGRAGQTVKRNKKDKEELYLDLKAELERCTAST